MTPSEKDQLRKQIHELVDIVIDCNGFERRSRDKTGQMATMFVRYSGHVNGLEVDIYPTGWQTGVACKKLIDVYLDRPFTEKELEAVRAACNEAKTLTEADAIRAEIQARVERNNENKEVITGLKKKLKKIEKAAVAAAT